jgi:uncharacterized SAM-dependent methyltransferase
LDKLSSHLKLTHHDLDVHPLNAGYNEPLNQLPVSKKKVLLFLGANIGNMTLNEASEFLDYASSRMEKKDIMLIGFDLKKDPKIIHRAYDDKEGITRELNLNLLKRLNNTVGAKFDLSQFDHYPNYNPETGTASSYLISLRDQDVFIGALNRAIHFTQWETIHTEISQKYDLLIIEKMLTGAGLEIVDLFFDKDHYFCDVVATKQ